MHIGVGAAIVIVAVLYFTIESAGFRKVLGVVALTAVGLLAVGFLVSELNRSPPTPREAINLNDLMLNAKSSRVNDWQWDIDGVAQNNSDKPIDSIRVHLLLQDCPRDGGSCVVVGEEWRNLDVYVPVGQAREFGVAVTFNGAPPEAAANLRQFKWNVVEALVARS
jgi:hypothetical protein